MTHLRIEQNTTGIEEVSASIISKLYELAYAGLDASSNLQGRLHTPVSYRAEVQYLTANYPNLYITSDDYAIPFEDPNMLSYLNSIGVGSNGMITESLAAAATVVANSANTTVTKFNELKYFTSITSSKGGWTPGSDGNIKFLNWKALEEVDISNFTSLGHRHTYGYSDTFNGCTSLKKVTASNKLILIGHCAFRYCSNLEDITGLSGEIELACAAFDGCSKLKNSNFTNVLFLVGGHDNDGSGFLGCSLLTTILISTNTTELPNNLFNSCNNLTSVSGLSNVTRVGANVFKGCTVLSQLDLDFDKLTNVGTEAFSGCKAFLGLPGTGNLLILVEKIFNNCTGLTSIDLSHVTTSSGGSWVKGCTSLSSITTDWTYVHSIGGYSFADCTSLSTIDLNGITSIGSCVFLNDTALTTITNANGITSIGENAFEQCNVLTSISLGTLTDSKLPKRAFWRCYALLSITGLSNITSLDAQSLGYTSVLTSTDINWANITSIGNEAVHETSIGGNIVLNVCTTGGSNFFLNSKITSCIAPELISISSAGAFNQCDNLEFAYLPKLTTFLGGFSVSTSHINAVGYNGASTIVEFGPDLTLCGYLNNNDLYKIVVFRSNTPPSYIGSVYNVHYTNMTLYVPDAYISDYLNHAVWGKASSILPLSQYTRPAAYDALIPTT